MLSYNAFILYSGKIPQPSFHKQQFNRQCCVYSSPHHLKLQWEANMIKWASIQKQFPGCWEIVLQRQLSLFFSMPILIYVQRINWRGFSHVYFISALFLKKATYDEMMSNNLQFLIFIYSSVPIITWCYNPQVMMIILCLKFLSILKMWSIWSC